MLETFVATEKHLTTGFFDTLKEMGYEHDIDLSAMEEIVTTVMDDKALKQQVKAITHAAKATPITAAAFTPRGARKRSTRTRPAISRSPTRRRRARTTSAGKRDAKGPSHLSRPRTRGVLNPLRYEASLWTSRRLWRPSLNVVESQEIVSDLRFS